MSIGTAQLVKSSPAAEKNGLAFHSSRAVCPFLVECFWLSPRQELQSSGVQMASPRMTSPGSEDVTNRLKNLLESNTAIKRLLEKRAVNVPPLEIGSTSSSVRSDDLEDTLRAKEEILRQERSEFLATQHRMLSQSERDRVSQQERIEEMENAIDGLMKEKQKLEDDLVRVENEKRIATQKLRDIERHDRHTTEQSDSVNVFCLYMTLEVLISV